MTSPRRSDSRPGHAALRRGRHSQAGQLYLITFVTHRRRRLFSAFDVGCAAARALADPINWQHARLCAWVLMPDHWHGLIEIRDAANLSKVVQELKANSARKMRIEHPGIGRIWAKAFHDRALRCDDDLVVAARYLVMNPVRAGLTRKIREYSFWDAIWMQEQVATCVAPTVAPTNPGAT